MSSRLFSIYWIGKLLRINYRFNNLANNIKYALTSYKRCNDIAYSFINKKSPTLSRNKVIFIQNVDYCFCNFMFVGKIMLRY